MTIISCIKQVHDLDIVLKNDWIVEGDDLTINIDYANRIMNTFDETSLELMLRLKDEGENIQTKVVTLGGVESESILRKAMAVGVGAAVRIEPSSNLDFDPEQVAYLLKTYIKAEVVTNKIDVDLVLCGRQADNGNHGQTGQILAEMLGWPCITMVTEIKRVEDQYKISRIVDKGLETLYVNTPVVVTVTQSDNKLLRMATLKAMLDAKKKKIEVINGLEFEKKSYKLEKLSINRPRKHCVFIEDKADESKSDQLIKMLIEDQKKQVTNEVG